MMLHVNRKIVNEIKKVDTASGNMLGRASNCQTVHRFGRFLDTSRPM